MRPQCQCDKARKATMQAKEEKNGKRVNKPKQKPDKRRPTKGE